MCTEGTTCHAMRSSFFLFLSRRLFASILLLFSPLLFLPFILGRLGPGHMAKGVDRDLVHPLLVADEDDLLHDKTGSRHFLEIVKVFSRDGNAGGKIQCPGFKGGIAEKHQQSHFIVEYLHILDSAINDKDAPRGVYTNPL